MLPPRKLVALGVLFLAASAVGALGSPIGAPAAIVGVPLGFALILSAIWGGGPRPVPPTGYGFEEAMELLRRVTVTTSAVAAAATASAAALWWYSARPVWGGAIGSVAGIDVLLVFLLSLISVFLAVLTATGIVLVAEIEGSGGPLDVGQDE